MAKFDPERMAVYRVARLHSREIDTLLRKTRTRGYSDLVNQLRRATASMPANLLEAAGEWRPKKRLNYLMIAKGSTWECWAHTDTLVDFGIANRSDISAVRDAQNQITSLLIATIRNLESQHARKRRPTPP